MPGGRRDSEELPRLGSVFGRYRLDALLGRGGMGVVFHAFDLELQRPVAIKFLSPELARDQAFRERFVRESRMAAAIEHPAIVPIHEAGTIGDALFIVMRYVPGQDLGRILRTEAPLDVRRVLAIVVAVGEAIPRVGPWIARIPLLGIALLQGWQTFALTFLASIIIENAKGYAISPFYTGNHRASAFLYGRGPSLAAGGALDGRHILDLAPTLLAMLGVDVPAHFEGRGWNWST